jgi:hypothetical protein
LDGGRAGETREETLTRVEFDALMPEVSICCCLTRLESTEARDERERDSSADLISHLISHSNFLRVGLAVACISLNCFSPRRCCVIDYTRNPRGCISWYSKVELRTSQYSYSISKYACAYHSTHQYIPSCSTSPPYLQASCAFSSIPGTFSLPPSSRSSVRCHS